MRFYRAGFKATFRNVDHLQWMHANTSVVNKALVELLVSARHGANRLLYKALILYEHQLGRLITHYSA